MSKTHSQLATEKLQFDLSKVMLRDRFKFQKDLQRLASLKRDLINLQDKSEEELQRSYQHALDKFQQRFDKSAQVLQSRQTLELHIEYPPQLPVSEQHESIAQLIQNNQVVILAGETGSGKTTQLAKICLELGRGREALIAHTQPRRVAASSVASRIAEELQVELGKQVGYQIRFKDQSTDDTLLKLMTDGVLLAEIPHDRFLQKYDTIIIDEAHERSLNIDFLLGYVKRILPKRPDLKLIITSATIDVERFSEHFNNAPVKTVSGRTFPVDMQYRPVEDITDDNDISSAILATVEEIAHSERKQAVRSSGDVLVFLPGEHDIRQASLMLRHSDLPNLDVLPLYSRLSNTEHQKIFNPRSNTSSRRIILATNVAETSLTVPGIRYVIDSGLARMSRYSHRSKVQRLPIEKVSQASANQRAGRCGRISAGMCFRLYAEDDFNTRDEFTQPEIQRTNLSAVILQMLSMRLGEIENFPFVEAPDQRLINDGVKQLQEVAAIDQARNLTSLGRQMSKLPIDPRLASMLIQAGKEGSLKEVLIVVAALSVQDPRENPAEKREAAREKHSRFKDPDSDFISLLKLWDYLEELRQELSNNQFSRRCKKEFLAPQRVREWRETHHQLRSICKKINLIENHQDADSSSIHRALMAGLLTQIGFQQDNKVFEGVRNRQFRVFPASFLAKKPPKWVMAGELIETSQLFAHQVAKVDPLWIQDLGSHLLKYSYSEPHWSQKRGEVMAYQQSALYGLVIEDKKAVSYSLIDAKVSHEIFLRSALVEEQMRSNAPFYRHNRNIRKSLLEIEEKSRRRDVVANDERIYQFYAQLIPEAITNVAAFDKWRKTAEKKNPKLLFANNSHYQAAEIGEGTEEQFPNSLEWKGVDYALTYRFQPGHNEDGISMSLPVALLNRVPRFRFQWLVPGLLSDKCEALLRCLPKQHRRNLVPIPDTVKDLLGQLQLADMPLHLALAEQLKKQRRLTIPVEAWQLESLDNFFQMNFQLQDEKGKLIEQSRDLSMLLKKHGHKVQQVLDKQLENKPDKVAYSRWEFDDIQREQSFSQGGNEIQSFPAISDEGDHVIIRLTDYAHIQAQTHRAGVVRLAMLELSQSVKYLRKELLKSNAIKLKLSGEYDHKQLLEDLIRAAFNHTLFAHQLPFEKQVYQKLVNEKRSELTATAQLLEKVLTEVLDWDYKIRQQITELKAKNIDDLLADIQQQRQQLFYNGFLYYTPFENLQDLGKYFKAISVRLERMQGQIAKDRTYTEELSDFSQRLSVMEKDYPGSSLLPAAIDFRWMLEEYRLSLFAQQLKTKKPISAKRLDKQWQKVLDQRRSNII